MAKITSQKSKSETRDSQQTNSEVLDLSGTGFGGTVFNIDSLGNNTFQSSLKGQNRSSIRSASGGKGGGGIGSGDGGGGGGGSFVDSRGFGAEQSIAITLNEGGDVSADVLNAASETLARAGQVTLDTLESAAANNQASLIASLDFAEGIADASIESTQSLAELVATSLTDVTSSLADFALGAVSAVSGANVSASEAFSTGASIGAAAGGGNPVIVPNDSPQLMNVALLAIGAFFLTRVLK